MSNNKTGPCANRGQQNNIFTRGTEEGAYTSCQFFTERSWLRMVTYDELFTFVTMLCAVVTLVVTLTQHKK